jgi:hypothetical protein
METSRAGTVLALDVKRSWLSVSSVFLCIIVQVSWLIRLHHNVTKFHEELGRISEFLQYCKTWSDEMLVEWRRDCCKLPFSMTVRCLVSWRAPTFRRYHAASAFRIEFTLRRMQQVVLKIATSLCQTLQLHTTECQSPWQTQASVNAMIN